MPVTAAGILPYIIDAARSEGYVGLMVILARTAEARTLHEELVRDWTSIHDVTGQRIAVLNVVQAGRIDAVHIHGGREWFGLKRKRGPGG